MVLHHRASILFLFAFICPCGQQKKGLLSHISSIDCFNCFVTLWEI